MSATVDQPKTVSEATDPVPESTDPDYLAWKIKKIRAAIAHADAHPDDVITLDEMAEKLRRKASDYGL